MIESDIGSVLVLQDVLGGPGRMNQKGGLRRARLRLGFLAADTKALKHSA